MLVFDNKVFKAWHFYGLLLVIVALFIYSSSDTWASYTTSPNWQDDSNYRNYADSIASELAFDVDMSNIIFLIVSGKIIAIELFPKLAPNSVKRFKLLATSGFYDNLDFYRGIDDIFVQVGSPDNSLDGRSKKMDLVIEAGDDISHMRSIVSMAGSINRKFNSQFFIVLQDTHSMDMDHSIIGRVVHGMDIIDNIKTGAIVDNGIVKENPNKISAIYTIDNIPKNNLVGHIIILKALKSNGGYNLDIEALENNIHKKGILDKIPTSLPIFDNLFKGQ